VSQHTTRDCSGNVSICLVVYIIDVYILCYVIFQFRMQGCGELLISLCYQPAANRLTVVVLKARNLPKMDLSGLSGKCLI